LLLFIFIFSIGFVLGREFAAGNSASFTLLYSKVVSDLNAMGDIFIKLSESRYVTWRQKGNLIELKNFCSTKVLELQALKEKVPCRD
jgi:hypothetical protein